MFLAFITYIFGIKLDFLPQHSKRKQKHDVYTCSFVYVTKKNSVSAHNTTTDTQMLLTI